MKFRSSRGENWVEDSCNATTVNPSTRAMTVTTVLVMVVSRFRASSEVPGNASAENTDPGATRISDTDHPAARASNAARLGHIHNELSRTLARLPDGSPHHPATRIQ